MTKRESRVKVEQVAPSIDIPTWTHSLRFGVGTTWLCGFVMAGFHEYSRRKSRVEEASHLAAAIQNPWWRNESERVEGSD
jgi:hypothetical protein